MKSLHIWSPVGALGLTILTMQSHAAGWKVFADQSDGVAFDYPNTWVVQPQRMNAFRVMVGAPDGIENCTLGSKVVPQLRSVTTEEMVRSTSKQDIINGAKQNGVDIKVVDFQITKVGNRYALYYESEGTYQSMSALIPIQVLTVVTKVDERLYSFSCASTPADIAKNKSFYRYILSTLTIRF
jgi:hypothetical protein